VYLFWKTIGLNYQLNSPNKIFPNLCMVSKLSIDVPMKKEAAARMRNTTAWMNRGNLWRYPRPLSCADCNKSKCHHRLSRVNKLSYFEVSTRRHLSLSLWDSHLHAHFQVSSHRALSHTHIVVTSMLISRCQNIVSLSPTKLSPRCLFPGVKPSSLSLSYRIVTSMLISRCQTFLSLSLSHIIVTPMLISSC